MLQNRILLLDCLSLESPLSPQFFHTQLLRWVKLSDIDKSSASHCQCHWLSAESGSDIWVHDGGMIMWQVPMLLSSDWGSSQPGQWSIGDFSDRCSLSWWQDQDSHLPAQHASSFWQSSHLKVTLSITQLKHSELQIGLRHRNLLVNVLTSWKCLHQYFIKHQSSNSLLIAAIDNILLFSGCDLSKIILWKISLLMHSKKAE